jgi:predicted double-glycine peptidase
MSRCIRKAWLACALIIGFCAGFPDAHAAVFFLEGGGGDYKVPVKSLLAQRFRYIDRQRFDYSCGSAALASLLTYYYNKPVSEKDVISAMYAAGDKSKIEHEGFSLLDMKRYLEGRGLTANGYREPLDKLASVGIPAIVLITTHQGYMHFVLIAGVSRDQVLLGDPAQGRKVMSRADFESIWTNHILFVIESDMREGRQAFNSVDVWHHRPTRTLDMRLPDTELAETGLFANYSPNSFRGIQ